MGADDASAKAFEDAIAIYKRELAEAKDNIERWKNITNRADPYDCAAGIRELHENWQMEKAEAERLREEKEFYKRRCDALQKEQSGMRDPERQIVCDILANGKRDAAIDAARAQGGES